MTTDNLSRIREEFSREGVMICFNGAFAHSIIEEIGKALRRYMDENGEQKGETLDVFSVYIEQAQNVRNYLARRGSREGVGTDAIIVISRSGGHYAVSSGNAVAPEDVPELTRRLEQITSADEAGLRALFKERLRAPSRKEEGSAGMGLIEIARRCKEPLRYAFHPAGNGCSFFCLTAIV